MPQTPGTLQTLQGTAAQALLEAAGAADARGPGPSNAQCSSLAREDDASAHVLAEVAQTVLTAAPAGATAARRAVALAREALAQGRARCGAATLRLLLAMLDVPAVCQARAQPWGASDHLCVTQRSPSKHCLVAQKCISWQCLTAGGTPLAHASERPTLRVCLRMLAQTEEQAALRHHPLFVLQRVSCAAR